METVGLLAPRSTFFRHPTILVSERTEWSWGPTEHAPSWQPRVRLEHPYQAGGSPHQAAWALVKAGDIAATS